MVAKGSSERRRCPSCRRLAALVKVERARLRPAFRYCRWSDDELCDNDRATALLHTVLHQIDRVGLERRVGVTYMLGSAPFAPNLAKELRDAGMLDVPDYEGPCALTDTGRARLAELNRRRAAA